MLKLRLMACAASAVLLLAAGAAAAQSAPPIVEIPSTTQAEIGEFGFDAAGMDTAVAPGDDFNRFASGVYLRDTPIPGDKTSYGVFDMLYDRSQDNLKALIEESAAAPSSSPEAARIGAFYGSFMDEATVERLGATPLRGHLDRIRAATTREALAEGMGQTMGSAGGSFFGAAVFDDLREPEKYALYMGQSGLGLPDREFYLRENFATQKAEYEKYVARMLTLAGWVTPAVHASAIVALESRLAEAHWPRAESRDRDKTYNPMTFAELEAAAPGFPWRAWAKGARVDQAPKAIVSQNTAFPKMASTFADTPVPTLQAWQAFHTVDQAAPYLSKDFATAHWEFRSKFLQGAQEERARWKRGVEHAEQAMGEAIGRTYVARHFPPASRAKMEALVADLKTAMRGRIERLDWMAPDTKAAALDKLAKFNVKIGYPDQWRDYASLAVKDGDLFGNVERSGAFEWAFRVARIGQPVDPKEWSMTPQTVNAYYSPAKNEIVFPAGILQPPYFDPEADPAVNYGAIGGVIGHEITHGFDDQGRKSDGNGVLRDWWGAEDAKKFEAQAERLGAQYEAVQFPQLPGMKLTGRLGMGENIADLGGVLLGLDAYRVSLKGAPSPVLDGFTGTQRVFMGWAQAWRILYRDDRLRQQIVNGPHSPGFVRAYAPLRNVDAWYEAFEVRAGEKLYVAPEARVRIW